MNDLYAVASFAVQDLVSSKNVTVFVTSCLAHSIEEAIGLGYVDSRKRWSPEEGWKDYRVIANLVPVEYIQECSQNKSEA